MLLINSSIADLGALLRKLDCETIKEIDSEKEQQPGSEIATTEVMRNSQSGEKQHSIKSFTNRQ
jgi:hypothetical protein